MPLTIPVDSGYDGPPIIDAWITNGTDEELGVHPPQTLQHMTHEPIGATPAPDLMPTEDICILHRMCISNACSNEITILRFRRHSSYTFKQHVSPVERSRAPRIDSTFRIHAAPCEGFCSNFSTKNKLYLGHGSRPGQHQ